MIITQVNTAKRLSKLTVNFQRKATNKYQDF